jgi:hypothetical protein
MWLARTETPVEIHGARPGRTGPSAFVHRHSWLRRHAAEVDDQIPHRLDGGIDVDLGLQKRRWPYYADPAVCSNSNLLNSLIAAVFPNE